MAQNCTDKNLLLNSGTSQLQREPEELAASYVHVDEHTDFSSLIVFAKKYGTYLNFYNNSNTVTGDWSGIMGSDVAVTIAEIGTWNINDYQTYITNLYDYIKKPDAAYNSSAVTLEYLFEFIFSISSALNEAYLKVPACVPYQQFLNVSIGSKLAVPLYQLISYYNNFTANNYVTYFPAPPVDPHMPVSQVVSLSSLNFLTSSPWLPAVTPTVLNLPVFASPPPSPPVSPAIQIVGFSLFTNVVSSFINGVAYIISQTETVYISQTLTNYPNHAPQYSLYLAFLRLFKSAQDHLNQFTWRHLEFYYKKVLQLANRAGIPDNVHLTFQLQKNTSQYLLPQGTQLKAGKDACNNNLFYALTKDIVLNQASVQLLKSLYLVKNSPANITVPQNLYASLIANSADGKGGKLTSPDQSWYPFGDLNNTPFTSDGAMVGFAIASNLLYLNEGKRTITLTFSCSQINIPSPPSIHSDLSSPPVFSFQFTGNKKWFDSSDFQFSPTADVFTYTSTGNGTGSLKLTIVLNGSAPPVVPYSKKIHGGNFQQELPMVQVLLNNNNAQNENNYYALKSLVISSVDIDVIVGSSPPSGDGVQNLVLQNKDGKIDTSKPFKPFGEYPPSGSSFIIGSKEIFQKKLSNFKTSIKWQIPSPPPNDKIKVRLLKGGQWTPEDDTWQLDGTASPPVLNNVIDLLFSPPFESSDPDFTSNKPYDITSVNGYIQLELQSDTYSLATYMASMALLSVNVSPPAATQSSTYTFNANSHSPSPSPTATSVSVYYEAKDKFLNTAILPESDFNKRKNFFYHIEPFGFREMHPNLLASSPASPPEPLTLLPVFNLEDWQTKDNGGELWIGLTNTQSGQTQSILFQVAEGSSNPLEGTTKVSWYYMSANNWIQFDSPVDQTNNLSKSGLVILNLPGNETTSNTRADAGMLWIKAVVQSTTDAVCKIIAVLANAAEAQFLLSPPVSFTANIPANTISKLAVSNAAIKQISQPYPSFGGSPLETNSQFNQRVSERLRHKNRAVTIWDYERLVLQQFPQIHKVKCLNHTALDTQASPPYSELKPGHVMIVTIPDLGLVTGANPLLPFTNTGLLADIKNYLDTLKSPFVHLHVCNPQFEGIQLSFTVTFINNNANFNYYKSVLDSAIQQFLLPWAFGSTAHDIEFGGTIEQSTLLNFVQNQPYVDHVTCFKMTRYIYNISGTWGNGTEVEAAVATTARSIFVPYSVLVPGTSTFTGNIINPVSTSPSNCNCNG